MARLKMRRCAWKKRASFLDSTNTCTCGRFGIFMMESVSGRTVGKGIKLDGNRQVGWIIMSLLLPVTDLSQTYYICKHHVTRCVFLSPSQCSGIYQHTTRFVKHRMKWRFKYHQKVISVRISRYYITNSNAISLTSKVMSPRSSMWIPRGKVAGFEPPPLLVRTFYE